MTDIDFNINIEVDTDYKDYYYYPSNERKIEVRYRKTELGLEKIRKVFRLESYPASIAKKIKERQQWEKFGLAKDSSESVTSKAEEVFIELTPGLKFVKRNDTMDPLIAPLITSHNNLPNNYVLNTKYYMENSDNNITPEIISEISKNYTNPNKENKENKEDNSQATQITQPDVKQEIKQEIQLDKDNKKSIVNCRHCNSSEHWSIKCPMLEFERRQKEEMEEVQKKQEEQKRQDDFIKARKEKDNLIGIKVSDFDTDFSEQQLKDHFKQFGNIHHFYNVKNKKTGKPSGTIYITYATQEENDRALIEIPRKNMGYIFPCVEIAKPRNN